MIRATSGCLLALAVTVALGACGSNSSSNSKGGGSTASSGGSGKPLKIGISLSASGDFSDPAHQAQLGYNLWADTVNASGGILGRKVQLKIVDDASNPNQAVT